MPRIVRAARGALHRFLVATRAPHEPRIDVTDRIDLELAFREEARAQSYRQTRLGGACRW